MEEVARWPRRPAGWRRRREREKRALQATWAAVATVPLFAFVLFAAGFIPRAEVRLMGLFARFFRREAPSSRLSMPSESKRVSKSPVEPEIDAFCFFDFAVSSLFLPLPLSRAP